MASNYEQPKLATSKQYNVSQGNIGQVKQQSVDWTDYESAKIWESVAKGTEEVNKTLQTQARLRGALDQTGDLVAENSWLTQDSYNQGRASVVAAQKKTSFLEQSQQLAKEIAMRGGTRDDYTREVTPLYQDYIKAVKLATLKDIKGEEFDAELDAENLKTSRTEMITYAALGYEQFQKTLEQQHQIDLYKLNGSLGTNLKLELDAANANGVPILITNAYRTALKENIAVDPVGGAANAEGVVTAAISEYVAGADMFKPEDMAKLSAIRSTLNMAELANFTPGSRLKVTEAISKKEGENNKFVDLDISNRILDLQNSIATGTYNAETHRALANRIEAEANNGHITPMAAQAFYIRLNNLNKEVAEQKLNSPETLRNMNEGGARLKYKGSLDWQELWAKDVFASFLAEATPDDPSSVAQAVVKYLDWAGGGLRKQLPFLKRYGAQQLMTSFTGTFDSKTRSQVEFESLSGYEILSQSWPVLAQLFHEDSSPELRDIVNKAVPQEFKQAMSQASRQLTGNMVADMNVITNYAKNNKLDDGKIANINLESLKGSALDYFAKNSGQATAKWWNSASEEVKSEIARQLNGLLAEPSVQGDLRQRGINNLNDVNSVIDGLGALGYFKNTGNRIIVADNPKGFSNLLQITNGTDEQLNDWLADSIDKFADINNVGVGKVYIELRDGAIVMSIMDGNINPKPLKTLMGDNKGNNLAWESVLSPGEIKTLFDASLPVYAQQQLPISIPAVGNTASSNFSFETSVLAGQVGARRNLYQPSVEVVRGSIPLVFENEGNVRKITETAAGVLTIGYGVRVDPKFVAESGGLDAQYRREYRDAILNGNKAQEDLAFSKLYALNYDQMMVNVRKRFPNIANTPPEKLTPQQTRLLQVTMISQWTGGSGGSETFLNNVWQTIHGEIRVGKKVPEAAKALVQRMVNAKPSNTNTAGKVTGIEKTIGGHILKGYGADFNMNQDIYQMKLKPSGSAIINAFMDYVWTHPHD